MNDGIIKNLTHTMQKRPSDKEGWYAAGRDISMLTPDLIREALGGCDGTLNNEYAKIIDRLGVDEEELIKLAEGLADFTGKHVILDATSHVDAFDKSGLLDIRAEARLPIMAMIGEELLYAFWYAARTSTKPREWDSDGVIQYDPKLLAMHAKRFAMDIRKDRFRRKLRRLCYKIVESMKASISSLYSKIKGLIVGFINGDE